MKSEKIAVITGDLINSRKIPIEMRGEINDYLRQSIRYFDEQNQEWMPTPTDFGVFRGDSFQMLVEKPEIALRLSLFLSARLRSVYGKDNLKDEPLLSKRTKRGGNKKLWDARMAIGIGEISYKSDSVMTSDGSAFLLSGHALDEMKKSERMVMKIQGVDKFSLLQNQIDVMLQMGSVLVDNWTEAQAQLAAEFLASPYKSKTQVDLEMKYGLKQTAISRRKTSGNIDEILKLCNYFEQLIPTLI